MSRERLVPLLQHFIIMECLSEPRIIVWSVVITLLSQYYRLQYQIVLINGNYAIIGHEEVTSHIIPCWTDAINYIILESQHQYQTSHLSQLELSVLFHASKKSLIWFLTLCLRTIFWHDSLPKGLVRHAILHYISHLSNIA